MGWLERRLGESNRMRFPDDDVGLAKLITNALFDCGYRRFSVRQGAESWVVWAKGAGSILSAKAGYELEITELPLGWFYAKKTMNVYGKGLMRGDVILFEEAEDVDSATADTITAWLATPAHLRREKFPDRAAG